MGQSPGLAEADPVRRSRQARTKILDTLVEIPGDAASDAGSTPAASTKTLNRNQPGKDLKLLGRQLGRLGTVARLVVGVGFLYLGVVGLPPVHLLPWWQVLIGLVAAPALVAAIQGARLAFTRDRLDQTGPIATLINFVVFLALLIPEPTRGATLVFLGASMVFAAIRGAGGCEIVAISNWVLGRDDHVGCPLFWLVDDYELRHRHAARTES